MMRHAGSILFISFLLQSFLAGRSSRSDRVLSPSKGYLAFATPSFNSNRGSDISIIAGTREGLVLSLSQYFLRPQQQQGSDDDDDDETTGSIHLILASQSPRRKEILDMMGLVGKFTPTPSPLDESALQKQLKDQPPVEYTRMLAEEKAKALAVEIAVDTTKTTKTTTTTTTTMTTTLRRRPTTLVLGSDTIVDLDGKILEKPTNEQDAEQMLQRLSGRKHAVHTGVAVYHVAKAKEGGKDKEKEPPASTTPELVASFTDTAEVCFAELSEKDIDSYIATKEPMDKAGSYGIQGIGGQFVSNVNGDFFTVMGLPMHRTSVLLAQAISNILKSEKE